MWQSEPCPRSLSLSARAALRAAVTLTCDQERRAALQTRRPTYLHSAARAASGSAGRLQTTQGASEPEPPGKEAWIELVRLRRFRERMERALPLHMRLLGVACAGERHVVQAWAEVLWATVIEPLQELAATMSIGHGTREVLSVCLEHRRVAIVLVAAAERCASALGGDGGSPADTPRLFEAIAQGDGRRAVAHAWSEELCLISDRSWYSPFVFEWLRKANAEVERWLWEALDEETNWRRWRPHGPERQSRTLSLLYRVCLSLVTSLRRLGVVHTGEAVSAAQAVADHHATFASQLAAGKLMARGWRDGTRQSYIPLAIQVLMLTTTRPSDHERKMRRQ